MEDYFDAVKDTLVRASLMYPPNYQNDYFLYIVTTETTISMVLVQVEDVIEHLIYYLSRNLNDTEVKYSYVENLALEAISYCNPMTYILSRQLLGGEYSKWIVILQEFDLEFIKSKSNKHLVWLSISIVENAAR